MGYNIKAFYSACILIIFTSFTSSIFAQCVIENLTATPMMCNDADQFNVELNFDYSDVGDLGFTILGNGNNYGNFEYESLPVTLFDLPGGCETNFEFIVRDIADPTCSAFTGLENVCCSEDCSISVFEISTSECDEDGFVLTYQIEGEGNGDAYSIYHLEEVIYTGEYSSEPISIELNNIESSFIELTFCDNLNPDCCFEVSFSNPCNCNISNITNEIVECNSDSSTFYILLDFETTQTADSFILGNSSGFLGVFAYANLPIIAGPIPFNDEEIEILIVDQGNPFCFNNAFVGTVNDCDINCLISNTFAELIECENGEYFIDIEFEAEDIEGNQFEILVDNESYGIFEYGESSYEVGPIPDNCEAAPTVVIQDYNNEACSDFFNFSDPICCPGLCSISEVVVEAGDCDGNFVLIDVAFNFDGAVSDSFEIRGNGNSYGIFAYGEDFYTVGPIEADCETIFEFIVIDSEDAECKAASGFEEPLCCEMEECNISEVFAEAGSCDGNLVIIDITFQYTGEVSDSFKIVGNGNHYGTFAYGQDFYPVGPVEADCETLFEFVVMDLNNENCIADFGFDEPLCCSVGDCIISDVFAESGDCDGNFVLVDIEFFHNEAVSDSFEITGNGMSYGVFAYGSDFYTIGPIETDCETIFEFVITDTEINECSDFFVFEEPLCCEEECDIRDLNVEIDSCFEDIYYVSIDFIHENTSDSFFLINIDIVYGPFAYSDLPIIFGPLSVNVEHPLTISDSEFECFAEGGIFLEMCETSTQDGTLSFLTVQSLQNGFMLTSESKVIDQVSIRSMGGEHISTIKPLAQQLTLECTNLSSGLYFLNVGYSSGEREIVKVVWIR